MNNPGGIIEETKGDKRIFTYCDRKATVAPVNDGFRIKLPGRRYKYYPGITRKGANRRARKAVRN